MGQMLDDACDRALMLLSGGGQDAAVGKGGTKGAFSGVGNHPGEQRGVSLKQSTMDKEAGGVEEIEDGSKGDGEKLTDLVQLGAQINLSGSTKGDNLLDIDRALESPRDAPG